jgi:hypothetical protein
MDFLRTGNGFLYVEMAFLRTRNGFVYVEMAFLRTGNGGLHPEYVLLTHQTYKKEIPPVFIQNLSTRT